MKKSFTLSIPKPCHEKYENFNPTTLGGFCSSCQKEVIDFTSWDEDRIKSYFKNGSQTSCGRFNSVQLKSYTLQEPPKFNFFRWTFIPFLSIVMLLFSRSAHAQKIGKVKIEQVQKTNEGEVGIQDTIRSRELTGIVLFEEDQTPLPGVNVILKGTTISTVTNADGRFAIHVEDLQPDDTLVFSFIGLTKQEQRIDRTQEFLVKMQQRELMLGGTVVVSGIISDGEQRRGLRNMWWKMKNIFRKN